LKATSVGVTGVTLKWTAPKGAKPTHYLVLRDGKSLGKTTRNSYTDSRVKPGKTYRYAVRALDERKRPGALSASVRIKVPKAAEKLGPPAPTTNTVEPIATVTPTPVGSVRAEETATPASTPTPSPTASPSPSPSPEPSPTASPSPSPSPEPTPSPTPTETPTPSPTPTAPPIPDLMTEAMVDRLFWRAGFGPLPSERTDWVGRRPDELVDWFLTTPNTYATTSTPPVTAGATPNQPIVAINSEDELTMEWLYRMQTAVNPLPERLAFFWHRHWAVSRDDGQVSTQYAVWYRDHLMRFSDFAADPALSFRTLAYEMTTQNAAMSVYLDLFRNTRNKPNENYAREFMELFCLGPTGPDGTENYLQSDVETLARCFTGWTLQNNDAVEATYGTITFVPNRFDIDAKQFSAKFGDKRLATTGANGPQCVAEAIDMVLAHPGHAQFLIRKLWAEFIASPIPQATLDALVAAYRGSGYQMKPVIRGILTHPLIFESLDEPNLIKPPVVYLVGVLRAMGVPMKGNFMTGALTNMQQRPYRPPNVAGWEGGMSWLNTNTVQGRFDLIVRAQYLLYSGLAPSYPRAALVDIDKRGESPEDAFTRAIDTVNRPWLSAETRTAILDFSRTLSPALRDGTNNASALARRQRFYTLQALMLGGPDGQVM
jgi:uncharacterized protein (DUF1800 family)